MWHVLIPLAWVLPSDSEIFLPNAATDGDLELARNWDKFLADQLFTSFFLCKSFFWLLHRLRKHNTNSIFKTWSAAERARGWKVALHKTPGIRHCLFPSSEHGDERWIDYFGKKNSVMWILTSEGNCALRKARVFCFPEAEQGGGEQRVIDEILHVVALTFLFGFRAHLICHILPVGQKWHRHKKYRPCVQTLWERVWINKPGYKYFRCNS